VADDLTAPLLHFAKLAPRNNAKNIDAAPERAASISKEVFYRQNKIVFRQNQALCRDFPNHYGIPVK
jgi:hypothetical protein